MIEHKEQIPLKWPEGWSRTLIGDRKGMSAWKKPLAYYREAALKELKLLGVTAATISRNELNRERQDPGVALWFSIKPAEDFSWQAGGDRRNRWVKSCLRVKSWMRNRSHRRSPVKKKVKLAGAPIDRLREKLSPFYKLLQAIFGDIDELAPDSTDAATGPGPAMNDRTAGVWNEWKQRFPGAPAKIIDALQKHGSADTTQLCVLIGTSRRQTVHDAIHKLNASGLIDKDNGRFSLKSL